MLSTIVVTSPAAAGAAARVGALVRTLSALVPVAVEGVVRDVTLLEVGDASALSDIAEEAGCGVVHGGDFSSALARGIAGARSPWIFVVKAGTVPPRLFGEEAASALVDGQGSHTALLLRGQPMGLLARLLPSLAPAAGVILQRDRLSATPCSSFADVVRRARPATALPSPAIAPR